MLYEKETSPLALPVLLLSVAVVGLLGLQTWLLSADRAIYSEAYTKQDEVLANLEKAKTQSNDLVKGIVNLAKQDNRNAENIINELRKAGINFQDLPAKGAPAAAAPAAAPVAAAPIEPPASKPAPTPAPAQAKK